jgi:uncharacterized membrane protein YcaP (DUF421 family)
MGTDFQRAVSAVMLGSLREIVDRMLGLGLESHQLHFSHMAWRAVVVFCVAVALARIADRRFMGRNACYDFMLGIILGSVLSRGVNGQAAFFPTLGASALLVIMHRLVGAVAYHSHWFSCLVKGQYRILVHDGRVDRDEMRRNHITIDDLEENLRMRGNVARVEDAAEARLERNGNISVVKREGGAR